MAKKERITQGGNVPLPGQKMPATIVLRQPDRFFLDLQKYMNTLIAAENVDYPIRWKIQDLYTEIMMDAHLTSVTEKLVRPLRRQQIEFKRDGVPDETINIHLRSPWFFNYLKDIIDVQLYGPTSFQFYRDKKGWINYDMIPRKHVDQVRQQIMRQQYDLIGTPLSDYGGILTLGKPRDLGKLIKAAPYVIYKRNSIADWAQFAEIFGMPIREYTYDANDEEARKQLESDAYNQAAAGVFIHPKEAALNLIESGNKSGSGDLYKTLKDTCNEELSKLFLGNTLTTEATNKGTQALGTVHADEEDDITAENLICVLNILNYEMSDILSELGLNTEGGRFELVLQDKTSIKDKMDVFKGMQSLGIPISPDHIYEETGIPKPDNFDELMRQKEEEKALLQSALETAKTITPANKQPDQPTNSDDHNFIARLKDFFVQALPHKGGANTEY